MKMKEQDKKQTKFKWHRLKETIAAKFDAEAMKAKLSDENKKKTLLERKSSV
jgi:hypothetical protein